MVTIKDVFEDYNQLNNIYDAREIEAITLLALNQVTEFSKATIKAFSERQLTNHQSKKLKEILLELLTGKPIQYILGVTDFYGLTFKVNSSVLIPRPETEELVAWIIDVIEARKVNGSKSITHILDIGTGSGCIAISLRKKFPDALVAAMDISNGALITAKENAKLNAVEVDFIHADILDLKTIHHAPATSYHIIVSNPPYVTSDDKELMHANVTDFEPHGALFVPDLNPLIFYNAIADYATSHLLPTGLLFFEINENYGNEVVELLHNKGFINIELRKDMSGKHRMVSAEAVNRTIRKEH